MKGTICQIGDFLENKKLEIKLNIANTLTTYISFDKNRVLEVPMYQREIRWDEQHVNDLLKDVLTETKFLGNIFLSEANNNYELIDGQQRLTTLYIIIKVLRDTYSNISNKFKDFNLIQLNNYSFQEFYNLSTFDNIDDPFNQKERYTKIHEYINEFMKNLSEPDINKFCRNLYHSELNIILLENNEQQKAISGFIDINVKGVKLDSEDILKGYFFRIANNSQEIKDKWVKLKVEFYKLKDMKSKLELTELFYNIIFCIIRNSKPDSKRNLANFNKKFLLEDKVVIIDNEQTYSHEKGAHVMDLINDYSTVDMILDRAIDFIELNLLFFKNEITKDSTRFSECFGLERSDTDVKEVCFKMVQTLIRNNISIYRFLATSCYMNGINKYVVDKKHCENMIYYSYFYSFIFDALATRKGVNSIAPEIGNTASFCDDLLELSKSILQSETEPRLNFTQKLCLPTDGETQKSTNGKFTVLHFASLFECFKFSSDKSKLVFNKHKFNYINNLTNEHFFINNGGSYLLDEDVAEYTSEQKKIKDYFVNLVPFSRRINDELGNMSLKGKINFLNVKADNNSAFWTDEACEYTQEYIKLLGEFSNQYDYSIEKLVANADTILNRIYERFLDRMTH